MEFAFQDVEELAFTSVGAVCLHPEEELPQAAGNSQLVAASSLFGLVFFADGLGASRASSTPVLQSPVRGQS